MATKYNSTLDAGTKPQLTRPVDDQGNPIGATNPFPVSTPAGGNVDVGAKTDAPATTFTTASWSLISIAKAIGGFLNSVISALGTIASSAITVQTSQPVQFSIEVVHETGKTMAANDVIGPLTVPADAVTGSIVLRAGQPFRITQLHLKIDSVVATVLAAQMRIHFFNDAATVTPIAGNSQNTLLYANTSKRIGVADFYGFKTAGTGSTGSFSIGQFQSGYASFLDGIPVARQLSFRIENITAGTVLATGQKLTLMGMVQPL